MKTILLGAAAALALSTQPAHAGRSCGSGGSSSGDSSSNDNDRSSTVYDDSSWSAPTTSHSTGGAAETSGCTDASDVVGYRYCTKYGHGWATNPRVPRLFVELGTNVRQFSADPGARTGSVWHGSENFMYRMVAPSGDSAAVGAVATTLRIGVGLPHSMYAGIEGELGGLTSSNTRLEMMASGIYGSPEVETRTALLLGGAGFVGARVSSGRASLAIEGAGGVRDVRYRAKSSYHHCEEIATVDVVQGVLEARARGELWLNPWITLGAQAGANVAAKGDWMTGLYLGFHSRAFGGR